MSALQNGLYYLCAYTQRTCLQPNDADAGSPLYAWAYTGAMEQKWSITQGTNPETFAIQNLRYETYLTWPGGNPTGPVPQGVIQTASPIVWCIRQVQTNGNYILISPDSQFQGTWNVMGGSAANNTPIIIYPLDAAWDNAVFQAIPAPRDTFTSIDLPTHGSIGSLTATSLPSPTFSQTLTGSPTSGATTTATGDASTTSAPPSTSGRLSLDNKIGLGVGIGFGVPTLLLSIWGIWVSIRIAKGRYAKKFQPLPSGDPLMGGEGYYELPNVTTPQRHEQQDWRYTGLPRGKSQ